MGRRIAREHYAAWERERQQAAREKWKVVGAYKDAAISGASVTLRPGIQALPRDAQPVTFFIYIERRP